MISAWINTLTFCIIWLTFQLFLFLLFLQIAQSWPRDEDDCWNIAICFPLTSHRFVTEDYKIQKSPNAKYVSSFKMTVKRIINFHLMIIFLLCTEKPTDHELYNVILINSLLYWLISHHCVSTQTAKFHEPVTLDFLDAEIENEIKVEVWKKYIYFNESMTTYQTQ